MTGDDFKQHSDAQTEAMRLRDFDDLQNEQSGAETGRIQRFGVGAANKAEVERKKEAKREQQLSALEKLLLNDQDYADLYNETMDLLVRAENAAENALIVARDALEAANETLQDTQDRANQLPDGTRIYKDADGTVWTEDGRKVEAEELEGVVWKDGAPSYEDFIGNSQAVECASQDIREIEDYLYNVLGKSRERLTNPDNPPVPDDITGIHAHIREQSPPKVMLEQADVNSLHLEAPISSAGMALPKI